METTVENCHRARKAAKEGNYEDHKHVDILEPVLASPLHSLDAAGKMFFYNFAEFILILRPNEQYKPYISTNPHGDCQPGSSTITHTVPKPNTRHTEANDGSGLGTRPQLPVVAMDQELEQPSVAPLLYWLEMDQKLDKHTSIASIHTLLGLQNARSALLPAFPDIPQQGLHLWIVWMMSR